MINYTEKGAGMHQTIYDAGYRLENIDGVWISDNDTAVQIIIDNYDPIPEYKAEKIAELKQEAVDRANTKYSNINSFDDMLMIRDIVLSINAGSRTLTTGIQFIADIYQAGSAASSVINAMTLETDIKNYDVVNTPAWPV